MGDQMKADIKTWKAKADAYGRGRKVLISIGGQNGVWPTGLTEKQIEDAIVGFIKEYDLDGLDIDLEGKAIEEAKTVLSTVIYLRKQGYTVTAAPEASMGPL